MYTNLYLTTYFTSSEKIVATIILIAAFGSKI